MIAKAKGLPKGRAGKTVGKRRIFTIVDETFQPGSPVKAASTGGRSAPDAYQSDRGDVDTFKLYMQEIGKVALLTGEEEVALAKKIKRGDRRARNQMIRANLRLVVKIAMDYRDFGLPLPDLISEGNLGLIKAVERFDPAKGGKLSTYAAWWIKQSIKRALANQSKTIRLPVHLMDKLSKIRRAAARLADELGRDPTDEEIAFELELPVNKVAHLRSVSVRPASLDARIGDEESSATFGDVIGDENAISPFETLREKNARSDLRRMIDSLDEREARIIRLRFGLEGERALTLEEVGRLFHLTRERVRQLQNLALSRMRNRMAQTETQRTLEEIRSAERARARDEVLRDFYEDRLRQPRG